VERNRDTVLEPSSQPCYYSYNKLSTQNFIRKYFVGNLVTAAPPQYSSAIRLCWRGGVKRQWGDRKRRFSEILDAMSSAP